MKEELLRYLEENDLWDEYLEIRDRFATYEKCMAEVRQNSFEIMHVDASALGKRYSDVCLAAVRQTGYALEYVEASALGERYYDVCLAAMEQNGLAIIYIKTNLEEER